ncbi:MAG: hypothetical protein AAF959_20195 [Cyanobacteria bacterium P01_D01_bin.56]
MTAVIQSSRANFNGVYYFRGGAENVTIGCYGVKRTPGVGQNRLEVDDQIQPRFLKVQEPTVVDINFSQTSTGEFEEGVSAPIKVLTDIGVDATLSASQVFSSMRSGELKLAKFAIRLNDLRDAANADREAFNDLRNMGFRARVAHEVWVVMETKLFNSFSASGSLDVSGTVDKINVTATVNAGGFLSRTSTIELSAGTTFCYLLANPQFDKRLKRRRTKIERFTQDQWGIS